MILTRTRIGKVTRHERLPVKVWARHGGRSDDQASDRVEPTALMAKGESGLQCHKGVLDDV